ncbi:MAG TPA: hypothetical protein VMG98_11640 [Verrucomicrobiae bacterium]|nr:hypothetical protein [Verrucomicrobiae bacterium]
MKSKVLRLLTIAAMPLVTLGPALNGAAARADSPNAPVQIQDCVSTPATEEFTFPGLEGAPVMTQLGTPAMVIIHYVNASSNPIATIDFGLVSGGKLTAMVRDVGTFAPQADVMHAFGINDRAVPAPGTPVSCVPLRIHYANGGSWTNPAPPSH